MIDVEQRLRDELDRWQPLTDVPVRWDDVLARARAVRQSRRPRRPSSRTVAVVVVVALALLVGGTAYAIARGFFVGDPAPPEVKEQAALLNEVKGELIPRVHRGPGLRVDETRLAARLDASTGPVYLWVTPTTSGGYCLFKQIVGTELPDGRPNLRGGCGGGAPLDSQVAITRVRDGRLLALVYGRAAAPISRVVIERDGTTTRIPLAGQFFLYELPGANDDLPNVSVVAYGVDGDEIARREHGGLNLGPRSRPLRIDVRGEAPLLEITTRRTGKPIRLYVVERDGERYTVLVSPGGTSTGWGRRRAEPHAIAVAPTQIGGAPNGMLLLWGEVGSAISELELRFEDGRVERLPLAGHFTLYQVDPDDFVSGRRPILIVGTSSTGEVIAERRLGPWRR